MSNCKKINNNLKGYTLIELLVITGVISIAAVGVYSLAIITSDWRKSSQEVKSLGLLFSEIDNSLDVKGDYSGITLSNLSNIDSKYVSALTLNSVNSPNPKRLNFNYIDIKDRICNDFVSKMLTSSKKVTAIINDKNISSTNLTDIVETCESNSGRNSVTIVLNNYQDDYTINNVVASINPPPAAPPDIVWPSLPIPQVPPIINPYIPSGLNPGTYPITDTTPPPVPGLTPGGGPITTTPGTGNPPVTPSPWVPPPVVRPPGTPPPVEGIDQDPNPPIITTETRSGSCPAGYIGSTTETRMRIYYPSTGVTNYTPWVEISRNCTLPPPPPPPPHPCSFESNWSYRGPDTNTWSGWDSSGPFTTTCTSQVYGCSYYAGNGVTITEMSFRDQVCSVTR